MSHSLARLEMAVINLSPSLTKKFVSGNMGGEFLQGGALDSIRSKHLSQASGNTVFIFGAGIGNDLAFLPKDKIGHVVGIDITDKYQNTFLKKAAALNLSATLEVGNILDKNFARELVSKYGQADSIVVVLTLCCIRRPNQVLNALAKLLADNGQIYIIEHIISPVDIDMLRLQKEFRNTWMEVTGGADHGGCDLTLDLVATVGKTDLLIEAMRVYQDDGLLLQLAAFQQPILFLKVHK